MIDHILDANVDAHAAAGKRRYFDRASTFFSLRQDGLAWPSAMQIGVGRKLLPLDAILIHASVKISLDFFADIACRRTTCDDLGGTKLFHYVGVMSRVVTAHQSNPPEFQRPPRPPVKPAR